MKKSIRKKSHGAVLTRMAESIGSTLGTLVAKASAAQEALTHSRVEHTAKHQGKKVMRKGEAAIGKAKPPRRKI